MGRTKKIKLETIAKETGISVSAVSLAISGKKGVGEKTRKLVLEKARELGYEENQPRDTGKDREKAAMAQVFIAQRFTDNVGGFRISCNWFNTKEDIDAMISAMKSVIALIGKEPDYKDYH